MKHFPQNQNRLRNRNQIWKSTLKDLLLNFKDPFILKLDLSLQIHFFLIPSFNFKKRYKPLLEFDQNSLSLNPGKIESFWNLSLALGLNLLSWPSPFPYRSPFFDPFASLLPWPFIPH
jgi:hypothetical protein